ncbi:MAG: matrixin family metalloprotease [Alphaproteobacteria bacterium]|nr:MAG: matrixin family metalloprotease [Alphaproteobacteria bacterium]
MSDYALEGPKWASSTITWSFANVGGIVSGSIGADYRATIEAAVARWGQVSNLTFKEVSDTTPGVDIRVGWSVFSGSQVGQTDYSYQLTNSETFVPGTLVTLEAPSAKSVGTSLTSAYAGTSTTLYETMLHEFGHALGLDHSTDPLATMYPYLGPNNGNLNASDIAGIHNLYGAVTATAAVAAPVVASAQVAITPVTLSANEVPVFRFFDKSSGTQFLTGDTSERDALVKTRPDLAYEGLGMAGIASDADDVNAAPVYRFFDKGTGTHLFTTSAAEVASITATRPDLVQEQSSFKEHLTAQAGDTAVYRFFEKTDGTHFFTASDTERASIAASRPDMVYEGIAFYSPKIT